jgi:hypothetical protein
MKPIPGRSNVILTGKAHRERLKLGEAHHCRRYSKPGQAHCAIHSGQTGPVTERGLANTVAAVKLGRARWIAEIAKSRRSPGTGRVWEARARAGGRVGSTPWC